MLPSSKTAQPKALGKDSQRLKVKRDPLDESDTVNDEQFNM